MARAGRSGVHGRFLVTAQVKTVERASTGTYAGSRRIVVELIFYGGHGSAALDADTAIPKPRTLL